MFDELFKDLLLKIFQLHSLYSRRITLNKEVTRSQKEVGFANLKTSRIPLGRLRKISHSLETYKQKATIHCASRWQQGCCKSRDFSSTGLRDLTRSGSHRFSLMEPEITAILTKVTESKRCNF
jgi:hypothetical protein